ncbi:MAG: amidohydrolase family protein [Chitinophagaceae bacterium]
MAYRKFKADNLFDGYEFLPADKVLITDEEGIVEGIVPVQEAGGDIQELSGILSPGLINCHCHLELSHMKGYIPEGTGLVKFVLQVVQQRHFPEEEILQAIEKAEAEMLANGIVAVGDICNNTLTIPQKVKGRINYHNFIEASGFNPLIAPQRFEQSLGYFREYERNYSLPVAPKAIGDNSIVPHAPYSVSDELWDLVIHFPGNHLLTIHNQETEGENEWFIQKQGAVEELYKEMNIDVTHFTASGKSSLQTYLPKFQHNQSVILVHNVYTSEEDILFAKNSGKQLYWCLCPNANQYITGQFPDINLLINQNCEIILGTDSLASNHQLSILEEMRTIQKNFPLIETATMLKWATSNGAKALQMDSLLGSFKTGKKPGIVFLSPSFDKSERIL